MIKRINIIQALFILIAIGSSGLTARFFFKHQFIMQVENQLRVTLNSLSHDLYNNRTIAPQWCQQRSDNHSLRLTLISMRNDYEKGKVLCDSHSDAKSMENHAERPEVISAINEGFGKSIRFSTTVNENMLYCAIAIKNQPIILRGAIPLSVLGEALNVFDKYFWIFLLAISAMLSVFAAWSVKGGLSELESSLDSFKHDSNIKAEKLKLAEQIRIDFVANVSHELRSPLTSIKGYVDTLKQDIEQNRPITNDCIEIISRNTNRLMRLINDLLDLSSLETNADELQKVKLNTKEITTRILQQVQSTYMAKNLQLSVEANTQHILADLTRLEQVLVNLIDNAIKYTPVGGKIKITWDLDHENNTILKIKDTGPGISSEHHARLFERFYRVDKARSRELGGTGLGLAIVKHIMQRHGGNIGVESSPGMGSTFICRFPNST